MITPQQKLIPLFTRELGDDFIHRPGPHPSPLPVGEGIRSKLDSLDSLDSLGSPEPKSVPSPLPLGEGQGEG